MITDKNFRDWYSEVFGYGYGTGDEHFVSALKTFMKTCYVHECGSYNYDYEHLEIALGATTAWLMISALCKCDVINYGSSPRFAWLDYPMLKDYIDSKTEEELYEVCSLVIRFGFLVTANNAIH